MHSKSECIWSALQTLLEYRPLYSKGSWVQCPGLQINWSESLRTPVATKNDECMDGSLTHVWSALSQHSLLRFCLPKKGVQSLERECRLGTLHSPRSGVHVHLIPQARHTLLIKQVKTVLGELAHNTMLRKQITHCLASMLPTACQA